MTNSSYLLPNSSFGFQYKFPSFLSSSFSTSLDVSHLLMHKHQFSAQATKQASSTSLTQHSRPNPQESGSSILSLPQKGDSVLSFLKQRGFSDTQLEKFVTCWPQVLSASIHNSIEPKLKILQDFGLSDSEIVDILSNDPMMLYHGATKLTASLSIYKSLLVTTQGLVKLLRRHKSLCYSDLEETLLLNIEFLKTCGVSMEQITTQLYSSPHFFMNKPERLRHFVRKVDDMGVERTSKMFIHAVRVVSSMSDVNWELKLKAFQELGFPKDDIPGIFRTNPSVFSLSEQKIKAAKQFLLETGKYDMSCIVNCPMSLAFSVEKRYKPRIQVLDILEKKNLIKKWPSLSTLAHKSNKIFFQTFVEPYMNEVGDTVLAKNPVSCKNKELDYPAPIKC